MGRVRSKRGRGVDTYSLGVDSEQGTADVGDASRGCRLLTYIAWVQRVLHCALCQALPRPATRFAAACIGLSQLNPQAQISYARLDSPQPPPRRRAMRSRSRQADPHCERRPADGQRHVQGWQLPSHRLSRLCATMRLLSNAKPLTLDGVHTCSCATPCATALRKCIGKL